MATPTDILRLQLMPLAETDWHTKTEANLNRLEEAIASAATISTTGGTTTLTEEDYIADQSRRPVLLVTGTLASNAIIQVPTPDSAKRYLVINDTTGDFTVTVRVDAAGGTVGIGQGSAQEVLALSDDSLRVISPPITEDGNIYTPPGYVQEHVLRRAQVDARVQPLKSISTQTPPVSPTDDDVYYVPTGSSGAWSGQNGKLAHYYDSDWHFLDLPAGGMLCYVEDTGQVFVTHSGNIEDFVGAGNVADGGITAPKLATNSVTTIKIADANVTEAKLASSSVALAKLKSDVYASENEAKTGTSTTKLASVAMVKHAAFPTGTRAVFQQTSAPTGWTKDTSTSGLNNSALRFVTGSASSGGTADFTTAFASRTPAGTVGDTALTIAQMPLHGHPFRISTGGGSTISGSGGIALDTNSQFNVGPWDNATPSNTNGRQIAGAGNGDTHTHTFTGTAMDFAVKYTDVVVAVKDSPT